MNTPKVQEQSPKAALRITLPLRRSTSSPAILPAAAYESSLPSLPRGTRLSATSLSFHVPKCPEMPVTPASPSSPAGQGSERAGRERPSFVRFSVDGAAEKDITPYSAIYGEHPRKFHFDRSGEKIPADCSRGCRASWDRWNLQAAIGTRPASPWKDCAGDPPPAPPPSPRTGLANGVEEGASLADLESHLRRLSGIRQQQRTLLRLGAVLVSASSTCGTQEQPASAKEILLTALATSKKAPHAALQANGAPRSASAGGSRRPTGGRRLSAPLPSSNWDRVADGQHVATSCSSDGGWVSLGENLPTQPGSACTATS
mmetsp:Transcript_69552/g.203539  ORF Transcript_69552/g.203539 Transcript_69552/m.203539 type:complete len:316 (+) Transcript_69552:63-1010(+)